MAQLPLIMIGRLPIFRKYPALGNVSPLLPFPHPSNSALLVKTRSDLPPSPPQLFFWLGLGSGFPLLAIAYIRF